MFQSGQYFSFFYEIFLDSGVLFLVFCDSGVFFAITFLNRSTSLELCTERARHKHFHFTRSHTLLHLFTTFCSPVLAYIRKWCWDVSFPYISAFQIVPVSTRYPLGQKHRFFWDSWGSGQHNCGRRRDVFDFHKRQTLMQTIAFSVGWC